MSEYKNGVNAFGNMSVGKDDRVAEVKTGRAVFVDEDKYEENPEYKLKVDKCLAEGFHRVGSSEGGGSSDFSTAEVTLFMSGAAGIFLPEAYDFDPPDGGVTSALNIVYSTGDYRSGETHKVVLYKSKLVLYRDNQYYADTVSVTGNAIYDSIRGRIVVSGDCTITMSE